MKLLKPTDAPWLFVESHEQPVHVAVMATCTPPKGAPDTWLNDVVEEWRQFRSFEPPFNYRARTTPPAWVELEDDEVDLDYHLRHSALNKPGGERELGVLVSRLHSQPLDRDYPLWEVHLIEGLEGGRFCMYMKMHHAQVDGMGGIRFMQRILSPVSQTRAMKPPWAIGFGGGSRPKPEPGTDEEETSEENGSSNGALSLVGNLAGQVRGAPAIGRAMAGMVRDGIGVGSTEAAVPYVAPNTILNGRIHRPRRFATQHYELDRIKSLAKAGTVTVNDVFLAICSGGLRRYLDEMGELPDRTLTTAVPVSIRPSGGEDVGTAISFIHAKLHTDIDDPVERLDAIGDSTRAAKARVEALPGAAMDAYTLMVMGPYIAQISLGLGAIARPMHNVVISNVPGPKQHHYLNGARVEEMYPVSLLFNGQALNITVLSYAGQFNIGFTGCRDSLPSMQRLAVYTGEALEELESRLG